MSLISRPSLSLMEVREIRIEMGIRKPIRDSEPIRTSLELARRFTQLNKDAIQSNMLCYELKLIFPHLERASFSIIVNLIGSPQFTCSPENKIEWVFEGDAEEDCSEEDCVEIRTKQKHLSWNSRGLKKPDFAKIFCKVFSAAKEDFLANKENGGSVRL